MWVGTTWALNIIIVLSMFILRLTYCETLQRSSSSVKVFQSFCHNHDVIGKSKVSDVVSIYIDPKPLPVQEFERTLQCSGKQFRRDDVSLSDAALQWDFVLCSCTRTDMVALLYKHFNASSLRPEAALRLKRKPDYDLCPVSFVKRIREDTIEEWDRRYEVGGTAGVTKLFFPSAAAAYKIVNKIDITYHTTQILTGHGGFAFYLTRFKLKEDPSCLCQPGVEETVPPDLLLECPIFASNRYDIELKLGTSMTGENLPSILGGKKTEVFLSYCKYVVETVNKRQ